MRQIALGIFVTAFIASSAFAQEPAQTRLTTSGALAGLTFAAPILAQATTPAPAPAPAPEPPAKMVTGTFGIDVPTLYVFRGIRQEADPKFTMQPYLDIAIHAGSTTIDVGSWNSFNTGSDKDLGSRGAHAWYESDIYGIATFTAGKTTPGVQWTSYTSPNNDYTTVNELAFFMGFDDSKNAVPVSPKILVGFETTDGQADAGANKGVYLELSAKPSTKLGSKATLNIPVKLGMSLKDYYELYDPNTLTFTDNKFGYFDIGANVSVPVGPGEVHGGVDVYTFGTTTKALNIGKRNEAVGSVGFSVGF